MKASDLAGALQAPDEPAPRQGDAELGRKLGDLRRSFNLNQITVVDHVTSISRHHLSMIETGITMPTVRTLIDLADFYEVSIDELLAHMRSS